MAKHDWLFRPSGAWWWKSCEWKNGNTVQGSIRLCISKHDSLRLSQLAWHLLHGHGLVLTSHMPGKESGWPKAACLKHVGLSDLSLQQKSREDGCVQGEAAGMSPRQQVWGMPARPHAHKEGRPILMTHIGGSEQIPTTSFLPETGRERKLPAPLAEGASLDLMCEACQKDLPWVQMS